MPEKKKHTVDTAFGRLVFDEDYRSGGDTGEELAKGAFAIQEMAMIAMENDDDFAIDLKDAWRALYVFADWVKIGGIAAQRELDTTVIRFTKEVE